MSPTEEVGSGEVTSRLDPVTDTAKLDVPPRAADMVPRASGEWANAAMSAGVAWLAVLCVGAVCLLAPKLQFPSLARGSDPVEIFTAVVVMSLGLLRVPIHIGGLTISALPLGALALIGTAIAWAAGSQREPAPTARDAVRFGARVAATFAAIGLLLSLVFRIRGPEPVAADAPWSLILTFVWCLLFASAGALQRPRDWGRHAWGRLAAYKGGGPGSAGLLGGAVMVVVASLLATAALLLWLIFVLATGSSSDLSWRDAAAASLYLLAFLPNIVTALVALSFGAPVLQGAQVGVGGELVGRLQEVSLLDWAGRPALAYALLAIPVLACTSGGWFVARQMQTRASAWRPVLVATLTFAAAFALLAWIGEARVGAGLVRDRGFARVAVLPLPTFAWGILWGAVFGWFGWELGLRKARR